MYFDVAYQWGDVAYVMGLTIPMLVLHMDQIVRIRTE
jgi:hypothetical protein